MAGLGNPGDSYRLTRHNIGFRVLDLLSQNWQIEIKQTKFKGQYGLGKFQENKLLLLKPQTYMNLSGEAVIPLLNWYQIPPSRLMVIYDDLDLPLGKIRIRGKGSAGGHNGLKSIIGQLGSQEFPRIRIGIGKPADPRMDTTDWVLGRFSEEEEKALAPALEKAVQAVQILILEGLEVAMNQFNREGV